MGLKPSLCKTLSKVSNISFFIEEILVNVEVSYPWPRSIFQKPINQLLVGRSQFTSHQRLEFIGILLSTPGFLAPVYSGSIPVKLEKSPTNSYQQLNKTDKSNRASVKDSNRGVQILKSLQNVRNLREILKIEGCNIGLLQKSRGAIAPLASL